MTANNKTLFKNKLIELVNDEPELAEGNGLEEAIYIIDELVIYGGFDCGYRGVDHNILKSDDVEWEEILSYGTLIVPETETYISDTIIEELEEIGYSNLPYSSNHITGF